ERAAGVVGSFGGAGSGQVEGAGRSVERAGVGGGLRRNPGRDRLRALETRGRVEVSALPARVERSAALGAARVGSNLLQAAPLDPAGPAGEDDRLVQIDAASARSAVFLSRRPRSRTTSRLGTRVHVTAVAVLAVVGHVASLTLRRGSAHSFGAAARSIG